MTGSLTGHDISSGAAAGASTEPWLCIQRRLAVDDAQELTHTLHITTVNISDKAGAKELLQAWTSPFP